MYVCKARGGPRGKLGPTTTPSWPLRQDDGPGRHKIPNDPVSALYLTRLRCAHKPVGLAAATHVPHLRVPLAAMPVAPETRRGDARVHAWQKASWPCGCVAVRVGRTVNLSKVTPHSSVEDSGVGSGRS